eukprot:TRINITY_DN2524_c0_g1_i1.p1 TRINITY_DN2524_c0_g1~~TRINITY_DN2524_c0_g1_i1.p1  ORF type:complete len:393 (+),score=73.19 TRINITY_DN2524_c0_g1_i1:199-1377(+)
MKGSVGGGGFAAKGKGGGFVEEDRGRDWHCAQCRERNFAKRLECFKCKTARPPDGECGAPPKPPPASGTTLNGMVKSYNKKGFGFIMCHGVEDCPDVYYTRESVSSRLLHPDMPGEHVTFEIYREGRRMIAKNIRPYGEDRSAMSNNSRSVVGKGSVFQTSSSRIGDDEDRSQDWACSSCGERNFVKRFECFRCKTARTTRSTSCVGGPAATSASATFIPPRRTFSPHAGSRAVREYLAARSVSRSSSRHRKRKKKKKQRSRSRSTGSSSSRSRKRSKKRKARKQRRSSSSSHSKRSRSSGSSNSSSCLMEDNASDGAGFRPSGNPEIDKAKVAALEQLLKLKAMESKEVRMTEWRALLRQWHPDKNPHRVDVATAVFQFLQKGKPMLDGAC